jgi:tetratricopeptide (TPR) repeat protein
MICLAIKGTTTGGIVATSALARRVYNTHQPERIRAAGDAARDRGDWVEATLHYRVLLALNPGDFAAWLQLGHILTESGNFPDALKAYGEALGLKENDADLLLNLGHLHEMMGHQQEATELYRRSLNVHGKAFARSDLGAQGCAIDSDVESDAQQFRSADSVGRTSSHRALRWLLRLLSMDKTMR